MRLAEMKPRLVRPLGSEDERRIEQIQLPKVTQEESAMPRGVYERKPRGTAPKKDTAAEPAAKKSRGQFGSVLAELYSRRKQIDAAIAAIEAL